LNSGLEIKAGQTVELTPGGYHVMFMELKRPLKQGETVKATLQFEKAGPMEVTFSVGAVGGSSAGGSSAPKSGGGHHHHH
jgi:copper(I)-binding protein